MILCQLQLGFGESREADGRFCPRLGLESISCRLTLGASHGSDREELDPSDSISKKVIKVWHREYPSLPHTRQSNTSLTRKGDSFSAPKIRQFNSNPSLPHKSVTCTQMRQLHKNPSLLHISVTDVRQFHANPSLPQKFVTNSLQRCVELTDLYGTDGFVSNWGICVETRDLCGSDRFGGLKRSGLCVEMKLTCYSRVCESEGYPATEGEIFASFIGNLHQNSTYWEHPRVQRP